MKKINIYIVALLMFITVSGCASKKNQTENRTQSQNAAKETALDNRFTMRNLKEEDLDKPDVIIHSIDELIYVLDYMAFYRIGEEVFFAMDDAYASNFVNPYQEFRKAFEQADLADVYACQLNDSYYTSEGIVGIRYSISKDIASEPNTPDYAVPIIKSFDDSFNGDAEYNIPIEMSQKKKISCTTSEQLFYLAMNGYYPIPEAGSIAEIIYQQAKEVIRSRIHVNMTDFEKIKAIYDYITGEIYYDYDTAYSSDTYLVKEQAYYLEGVFLNHMAVCDGKAKAYALLLNMIDIPCFRNTGVSEEGDHAWNMVQLEGTWYTSCTTYGLMNATAQLGAYLPQYTYMLTDKETPSGEAGWGYVPQKHLDIYNQCSDVPYDVYANMNLNCHITELPQVENLINEANKCGKESYKIEFVYTGADTTFEEQFITVLEQYENLNAVQLKYKEGEAYEIIRQ